MVDGIAAVLARIDGDCDLSNVTLLRVSNVNLRSAKIAHSLYLNRMRAIEDRTTSSGANEFEIEREDVRCDSLDTLVVVVAALPQDVEEQDGALHRVPRIVEPWVSGAREFGAGHRVPPSTASRQEAEK